MATELLAVTFTPSTTAIGGSLTASALVGLLPLATFFVLLTGFKLKAWYSGLGALAVAAIVAVVGFDMPTSLTALRLSKASPSDSFRSCGSWSPPFGSTN